MPGQTGKELGQSRCDFSASQPFRGLLRFQQVACHFLGSLPCSRSVDQSAACNLSGPLCRCGPEIYEERADSELPFMTSHLVGDRQPATQHGCSARTCPRRSPTEKTCSVHVREWAEALLLQISNTRKRVPRRHSSLNEQQGRSLSARCLFGQVRADSGATILLLTR
jgi:hypothetical protein